jgi:predicted transposase YbfD/YdcC
MGKNQDPESEEGLSMDYTTFQQTLEQITLPNGMEALSVYRTLQQVCDGRHKRGVRYSVALVLTLILLAKLAGMTTPLAVAEWVRLRGEWLRTVLPTSRRTFPCAATYSNVLRAVDAEQVNALLTQTLARVPATERCGDEPSRLVGQAEGEAHVHVALDGKTLRGTLGQEQPDQRPMHQLALYETKTGLLLKEQVTGEKQNELCIVSQFLTPLWVSGPILSADALHTQHAFCTCVRRWKGHYVLIAKDNQACLREDLQLFFSEPPVDCRYSRTARTVNKGHGRLELREIVVSTELNEFLAGKWTGVAQVFRLTRTVTEDGQTSTEVVYGITSLSPKEASAQRLLELVRQHWAIENRLRLPSRCDLARRCVSGAQRRGAPRAGGPQQFLAGSAGLARRDQCPASDAPF